MKHTPVQIVLSLTAGLLALQPSVGKAAIITESGSAPGSSLISQPDFSSGTIEGVNDYSDNSGPPAQSFTTGAIGIALQAITVKGFANNGPSFGGFGTPANNTWTITISKVTGGTLTVVDQEATPSFAPANGADYLTFTFASGATLDPLTQYAYTIMTNTAGPYFGFAKSSADVYAGGDAFQHGGVGHSSANGAVVAAVQSVDRTFFVQGTLVPEPGSALLMASGFVCMMARRRRA